MFNAPAVHCRQQGAKMGGKLARVAVIAGFQAFESLLNRMTTCSLSIHHMRRL